MITKCLKLDMSDVPGAPTDWESSGIEFTKGVLMQGVTSSFGKTANRAQRLELDEMLDKIDDNTDPATGELKLRNEEWAKIVGWWMNSELLLFNDWRRKMVQRLDKAVMAAGSDNGEAKKE